MKRTILVCTALLFFLSGCVTLTKIDDQLYDKYMTKSYSYSKDKCFTATLAAFKDNKTGIEKQDRANGTIITEKTVFYEGAVGGSGYAKLITNSHKYYLKITGAGNSATVKVYKYRIWDSTGERTEINAEWCAENLWNPFFKEIQNKLEEM